MKENQTAWLTKSAVKLNDINELFQFKIFCQRRKEGVSCKTKHLCLGLISRQDWKACREELRSTPPETRRRKRRGIGGRDLTVAHLLQKAAIGSTLVTSTSSSSAASAPAGQRHGRGVRSAKLLLLLAQWFLYTAIQRTQRRKTKQFILLNHSTNVCWISTMC